MNRELDFESMVTLAWSFHGRENVVRGILRITAIDLYTKICQLIRPITNKIKVIN